MRHMASAQSLVSPQICSALTKSVAINGDHIIALHLYRGFAPVAVKTIATVEPSKAPALLKRCRRHLETLGVESIALRAHREAQIVADRLSRVG